MARPGYLALVNAAAGSADATSIKAALDVLRAQPAEVEAAATDSVEALDRALDRLGGRRLVVLGGDGSLHAAVQRLFSNGRLQDSGPIGLVPLGTGNDLAGSLGIPTDPAEAAQTVVSGQPRPIELLVAEDNTIAVNAVHVGIGVSAAQKGAAAKAALAKVKLGRLGYIAGALAAGATEKGWHLTVTVDGKELHNGATPVLMAALALGGTIGGGARLVPEADPHDGQVDVIVWNAAGLATRIAYALELKDGNHAARQDVSAGRGTAVVISSPRAPFFTNNDGEIHGPYTSRSWEVRPDAWQIIVPAQDAGQG
ncbi:diacylglycerol kinase catalytic subunit [Arthrobacter crystallopoietes BAB-32]|uniref:Diacylglycerol kinase catalytic subunit n=1 Tax=Arthrobacter crystallopoietes BAB-32 TaxID=1246476 RepID=N1V808_9MICC|nr:diacylglycerol kinase family protein [Arthrobacter crystallopoietes]EMY36139.1 diacylglycerol kinase catalytic subunit [Arthrobacter crystallopoietes BAB-32]